MHAFGIVLLLAAAQELPGWLPGDGVLYSPCMPLAGMTKPTLSFRCGGVRQITLAPIAPHPAVPVTLDCGEFGARHRHEVALDPAWDAVQVVVDVGAGKGAIDEFSVGEPPSSILWIALGALSLAVALVARYVT